MFDIANFSHHLSQLTLKDTQSRTTTSSQPKEPDCYFSFLPNPSDHYSIETPLPSPDSCYNPPTPLTDPSNPLLSYRPPSALLTHFIPMEASKLMQFQTEAAHGRRSIDKPKPAPSAGTLMAASMFSGALPLTPPESFKASSSSRSSSASSASSISSGASVGDVSLMSPPLGASRITCARCRSTTMQSIIRSSSGLIYCSRCAVTIGSGGG